MILRVKSNFLKSAIFWGVSMEFRSCQNSGISWDSKLSEYFESHFKTKIASNAGEVSIESSVFSAFRGALTGGASYFHSKVMFVFASRKCYFPDSENPKNSQLGPSL